MIGSSSNQSIGFPMNPKAAEAELISKATQTAIVAARSILMSGGTEESALKTAKAAAESVLNPAASDSDTVSGRSTLGSAFGGRKRKAKRQAEVVASMALMSATSLHPNGTSGVSECDSINKMYGRNIITVRQDEPSVLSGSTRPPKPPTPKSFIPQNGLFDRSQQDETREPPPSEKNPISSHLNQPPVISPKNILSSTLTSILPKPVKDEGEDTDVQHLKIKTLSQSSTMDSERESSVESSFLGRSETEESDEDTSPFFFKEKKEEKVEAKSKGTDKGWSLPDALMSPLTATLNMFHCGQITSGDAINDVELMSSPGNRKSRNSRKSKRSGRQDSTFDSRDDTFDDETTAFTFRTGESSKKKGQYRDPDFATSYSYTSSHSEISDGSEVDLRVRSSIRDTMECIVNKSKFGNRKSKHDNQKRKSSASDNQWKSFEMRQRSPNATGGRRSSVSSMSSPKNSSKNKRPPRGLKKAQSFFKRDRGRKSV